MTVFGIDISHFQGGLSLSEVSRQGYDFVIAKATEGQGVKDETFHGFRKQARSAKLLFGAYHFIRSDSAVSAQADNLAEQLDGHEGIPVMIDCEPHEGSKPTITHVKQFMAACEKRNLRVTILYLPNFHFQALGRPSLPTDVALMQALYGKNPRGFGSVIYPGDTSTRWNKMGGRTPDLLQFGSRGRIEGFKGKVDVDAFRGTVQELKATGFLSAAPAAKAGGSGAATTVTVGPADTIEKVAQANGLTAAKLWRLNRKDLQAGERLRVR